MKKRRRRRKRRLHITVRGYIVLGVLLLALLFGVRVGVVACNRALEKTGNDTEDAETQSGVVTPDPAQETPAPEETPAVSLTPTPTSTTGLASTGARLPTKEEEEGAVDGIIRTSNVAMRRGAGKTFDIVRKYNVGERMLVFAEENGYSLVKVLSDERYGYISSDFIVKFGLLPADAAANTPVPAPVAGTIMGIVNVEELKLRSVPKTDGNTPIGMCKKGELVWVHFVTGEFYYVEVPSTGQKGYVFAEYVMTQAPAPTGSPVPGA